MAEYKPYPNAGSLSKNKYKSTPNQPDVRGDIYISVDLIKDLMPKAENGLVKFNLSGWKKPNSLSITASAPFVKQETAESQNFDEDMPF
jgi:hypothetical protein